MMGRGLTTRQREALWLKERENAREAGRGERPICRLCDLPIEDGQTWDENHEAHKPRWLGGAVDGISHSRCNRLHNNKHDTPLFAKNERVRKRHMDFTRPQTRLAGNKFDPRKKKLNGQVVDRETGEPWGVR